MIREEIIHITRVRLFTTLDFTLVLLVGSTIELPELILGQLILYFPGTACTAWTQKEREQSLSLNPSFSFCDKKFIMKIMACTRMSCYCLMSVYIYIHFICGYK